MWMFELTNTRSSSTNYGKKAKRHTDIHIYIYIHNRLLRVCVYVYIYNCMFMIIYIVYGHSTIQATGEQSIRGYMGLKFEPIQTSKWRNLAAGELSWKIRDPGTHRSVLQAAVCLAVIVLCSEKSDSLLGILPLLPEEVPKRDDHPCDDCC